MFFIDKPYASEFLKKTVNKYQIPVVETQNLKNMHLDKNSCLWSQAQAVKFAKSQKHPLVYMNSENAIDWIQKHLPDSYLPKTIHLFKDKYAFRVLTSELFPDFFFKKINSTDLHSLDLNALPLPFIIKPTVGFFSMGVYKVNSYQDWHATLCSMNEERKKIHDLYPKSVMNDSTYIIEQCIQGEEFAVDAYFNSEGKAIVLSVFKHHFSSQDDVSDRIYTTSKKLIETHLKRFTNFIQKIGDLAQLKNFPIHIELRNDSQGKLLPIEVNPMRFGGWCTTADMSFFAFNFNQYQYYYQQQEPDWKTLLQDKENKEYSIIVLDNSTGIDTNNIQSFDYDLLQKQFKTILEIRKIDHRSYPLFGFLFVETAEENPQELNAILLSDLKEYILQSKTGSIN